jgi:hypothetical protein
MLRRLAPNDLALTLLLDSDCTTVLPTTSIGQSTRAIWQKTEGLVISMIRLMT